MPVLVACLFPYGLTLTALYYAERGRVQLGDKQLVYLSRSKLVHLWLFVVFLVCAVFLARWLSAFKASMLPSAAFLLGGMYDAYIRLEDATTVAQRVKRMLKVLLAFGLGFVVVGSNSPH